MNHDAPSDYDALVFALTLAVTAPSDEKAEECARMAGMFAASLDEVSIARAKREAEREIKEILG